MRVALTAIVPIGLAVTIPASALTGRLTSLGFATSLCIVAAVQLAARVIFRHGIRA